MPMRLCTSWAKLDLVGALDGGELLLEILLVGERIERLQGFRIVHELIADRFADQRDEFGIRTASASGASVMPLVLLLMRSG